MGDVVIQFEREGMQDRLSIPQPARTSATILSKLQEAFPDRGVTAVAQENVGHRSAWSSQKGRTGPRLRHDRHSHLRHPAV